MEAIAQVVMHRLGHTGFPNTICGVVKQGHEQGACQFSRWCDGRADDAWEEQPYSRAKAIAGKALNRQLKDTTDGSQPAARPNKLSLFKGLLSRLRPHQMLRPNRLPP
jgi:spore germination cell wall hydrolase CwlJ-like protein